MRIAHWSKVDARWYLGVRCRKCEAPILFALDHSEGEAQPAPAVGLDAGRDPEAPAEGLKWRSTRTSRA